MNVKNPLFRSKLVLYTESILSLEIFFAPIMIVFYLNYVKLSFEQMSIFFSLILVLSIFLEIPCGAISDWFGRKKVFLMGKLIYLISMIMLIFIKDFSLLLGIAFFFALGSALSSGNLHAIIVETILKTKTPKEYFFEITTKAHSMGFVSGGIAAIIGGYLGSMNLIFPLVMDCFFLFVTIIIGSICIEEVQSVKQSSYQKYNHFNLYNSIKIAINEFKNIIKDGIHIILKQKNLLFIFLFSAICFGVLRAGFNYYQPILENLKVDVKLFGWLLLLFNIISAICSYLAGKVNENFINSFQFVYVTILFMLISGLLFLFYSDSLFIVLSSLVIHQIIRGFSDSYTSYSINVAIPENSEFRTTILSTGSFMKSLIGASIMSSLGGLTGTIGLNFSFSILSLFGGVAILICLLILFRVNMVKLTQKKDDHVEHINK
ncbi:MFS transporter [Bacillus thuringiensis]|uniref:MFS transporter n=1 Tax=Bacillus thuringiensis TaxID=1428 RepID=UPI0011A0028D|nr:MFS transporter [Bacillus thuringiensis]